MMKMSKKLTNLLTIGVVLLVVLGAVVYFLVSGNSTRKLTAEFTSAVGVYPGTPVKILGIDVGKVTSVTPDGATVRVAMSYDSKYKVPADAVSVVVANSLVSDRYIQLAPAYDGHGPTLSDGALLGPRRTASPAELDDIYSALNKISVALGPKGANKKGALNELVKVAAANLQGNGAKLGTSITNLAAAARTLANGRGDLFGTVRNLQAFTKALSDSDASVRHFNDQLATVAGQLADERADLGAALHNLGIALNQVATFVRSNSAKAKTDITGLKNFTKILVDQQGSLNETLAVAPIALANLVHSYQPDIGALGTRSNIASIADPAALCAILDPSLIPGVPDTVTSPLGPLSAPLKKTCAAVLGKIDSSALTKLLGLPSNLSGAGLGNAVNGLVNGVTGGNGGPLGGGIITGGG